MPALLIIKYIIHIFLKITLYGWDYYYLHFTGKEMETRNVKKLAHGLTVTHLVNESWNLNANNRSRQLALSRNSESTTY